MKFNKTSLIRLAVSLVFIPSLIYAGSGFLSNNKNLKFNGEEGFTDKRPLTAFGDSRVTELSPILQGSFEYTVSNTTQNINTVANSGTVTQASAMAVVGSGTTTASTALFQTKQHGKYRPGFGGLSRFTALFTACTTGTEQYIGLADEIGSSAAFKNGLMVGCDGEDFGFHRFQNDVKISALIGTWTDPLDGAGPSGMVIDLTKINVFFIEFQYLGGGPITIFVESQKDGSMLPVFKLNYTNQNTTPSIHNPNFLHTMWVANKATTSDVIIKSGSYSFFTEGKTSLIELHQPLHATGLKEKATVTTEVAILTIRNKATYTSKTNFIDVLMEEATMSSEASSANNLAKCRILKNTTLGGTPSYADINTTNSVIEVDTAGTTISGGDDLFPFLLAGKEDGTGEDLSEHRIILNPNDTLTLACSSGNSATINGAFVWRELF